MNLNHTLLTLCLSGMMVTTKAFLRGGPRDRGPSRQISMGTAIPDVPRRRPGGVSEVTGHRDPWEKRLPRAPSKGASDPGEESVTVPRDPQGRPPLTPNRVGSNTIKRG